MYSELSVFFITVQIAFAASCLYLPNIQLEGGTYDEFDATDRMQCCITCSGQPCCMGYTFNKELKRCYLKSSINKSRDDANVVSGIKANQGGRAASLRNVKLEGRSIEPTVQISNIDECLQFCSAVGIFTWAPARRINDENLPSKCRCIRRITAIEYEHQCHSYISPPADTRL